jgi:hypothetical protein
MWETLGFKLNTAIDMRRVPGVEDVISTKHMCEDCEIKRQTNNLCRGDRSFRVKAALSMRSVSEISKRSERHPEARQNQVPPSAKRKIGEHVALKMNVL